MRLLSAGFLFFMTLGYKEKEGDQPPVAALWAVDGGRAAESSSAHILILFLTLHFSRYFLDTSKDDLNKQPSRIKSDYRGYYQHGYYTSVANITAVFSSKHECEPILVLRCCKMCS